MLLEINVIKNHWWNFSFYVSLQDRKEMEGTYVLKVLFKIIKIQFEIHGKTQIIYSQSLNKKERPEQRRLD